MITIWKHEDQLQKVDKIQRNCWVNVIAPTPEEISRVTREFKVPDYFIEDIMDVDERSRTEVEGRWLLIILRIPIYRPNNGVPFYTIPLGVLISFNSIITICLEQNEIINDMVNPLKNKTLSLENKYNFVLNLFLRSATQYLKFLKYINIETSKLEHDLEKSTKNKELHRLLKMEKCLVFFITSLKSNELLLSKLKTRFSASTDLDEDLLEDVIIENKQALEMSKIYSDIQSGMMDAFASVISNNLNVVMKQLTSITIILMIPTLVASFYGMNITNTLETSKYGFVIIVLLSILLSGFGVFVFRKKKLF